MEYYNGVRIKLLMRFRPTNTQCLALYFIFLQRTEGGSCLFVKDPGISLILISKEASNAMEAKSLCLVTEDHHSWIDCTAYAFRSTKCSPSQSLLNRWLANNGTLLQKGHRPQLGHPSFEGGQRSKPYFGWLVM
jgi:hypothetical protein